MTEALSIERIHSRIGIALFPSFPVEFLLLTSTNHSADNMRYIVANQPKCYEMRATRL